jgi:hypothetical protein
MNGGSWQRHKSAWQPHDFPASAEWEVVACRKYHIQDADGRLLDEPIGAMFAIRDCSRSHVPAGHSG